MTSKGYTVNNYKDIVVKYIKDHQTSDSSATTHLSYGNIQGKYNIKNNKEFMKHYINAIKNDIDDLSILEKPKTYGPLVVDIDLEIPYKEDVTRLYNEKLIKKVSKMFVKAVDEKFIIDDEKKYHAFIFEKDHADKKEKNGQEVLKDGFHIVFPYLCIKSKDRHSIREYVVKKCDKKNIFDGYPTSVNNIIDKSVVSTNAWFMYGSRKYGGQMYKLTYILDKNQEIVEKEFKLKKLIKLLSYNNSDYSEENKTPLIKVDTETISDDKTNGENDKASFYIPDSKKEEYEKAVKLVDLLKQERADGYHDWICVGLVLHNIHDKLLGVWDEFSKKSSKYKAGECDKKWREFKNGLEGNLLTIRSLAYWAKEDSPKEFNKMIKEEFKNNLKNNINCNTYNLAKTFYTKYYDRFVCSSIKNSNWWEFKNHKWVRIENGFTLNILLSEEFSNYFVMEQTEIGAMIITNSGVDAQYWKPINENIGKLINKLSNITFKKQIVDECRSLFYDDKFEEKLDSNLNLIGFKNGVYDLERNEFRSGRPDDFISLSTNNDHLEWSDSNPYKNKILGFFDKVLPIKSVRDYFLCALCSCISGNTKEEKLYIMTGSGSNGKSLTTDLMNAALGDYYMACPITIITRKRGQANETSPEKVRMKGKRMGVFQETDEGERINVGVMKEITGGDKMLIRDLFKGSNEMIEFKPQMKYFLTCNQLPSVPSTDDGTWRRLRIIDFCAKFTDKPNPDPSKFEFSLDSSLKAQMPNWGQSFLSYLLHIYVNQYKKLTENGKTIPDPIEVLQSTQEFKGENDVISEFTNEMLVKTNNNDFKIPMNSVWDGFNSWLNGSHSELKGKHKKAEFNKVVGKIFNKSGSNCYSGIIFKYYDDYIKMNLVKTDNDNDKIRARNNELYDDFCNFYYKYKYGKDLPSKIDFDEIMSVAFDIRVDNAKEYYVNIKYKNPKKNKSCDDRTDSDDM